MSIDDADAALRIVEAGRQRVNSRLKDAFERQISTHADLGTIDPAALDRLVAESADRAGASLWRISLAEGAAEEFRIGIGQALTHPALLAAEQLIGAPPEPLPTPADSRLPDELLQPLADASPDAPADAAPAPWEQTAPEAGGEWSPEIPAAWEPEPEAPAAWETAPEPELPAAWETAPEPEVPAAWETAPEPEVPAAWETAPEPEVPAAWETVPEPEAPATWETAASPDAAAVEPAAPAPAPAVAPAAPAAAEPAAPQALRVAAVHTTGIESLKPGDKDLELRLSDAGLDVLKASTGVAIGRLEWNEITSVEVTGGRRGLRRKGPSLEVQTQRGQAAFELPGLTESESAEHLQPMLQRLRESGRLAG